MTIHIWDDLMTENMIVYKDASGCVHVDFDPPFEIGNRFGVPHFQYMALDVKEAKAAGYNIDFVSEDTELDGMTAYPLSYEELEKAFPDEEALEILTKDWMNRV